QHFRAHLKKKPPQKTHNAQTIIPITPPPPLHPLHLHQNIPHTTLNALSHRPTTSTTYHSYSLSGIKFIVDSRCRSLRPIGRGAFGFVCEAVTVNPENRVRRTRRNQTYSRGFRIPYATRERVERGWGVARPSS
ncbi:hypothetical protein BC829DRAFT_369700, partial [Chytridium lagenaria]